MLYTSYEKEQALLKPPLLIVIFVGAVLPVLLPDYELQLLATCCIAAIGAIGLGLVTGYAGQVSLGHAFFLAIGAYTGAYLSGDPDGETLGLGITSILIWLPASGLVAALAGVLVAPLATRLRGLYLAIVTLGLVFIGQHVFKEWSALTGGIGSGRPAPVLTGNDLITKEQKVFWVAFGLLVVLAVAARNLARSKIGRAWGAIRDRDTAAGAMGVNLPRYKTLAFAVSSFYAGCAGALLFTLTGFFEPTYFSLLLSVQYIAMVLIGGAGTVTGAIAGAFFITLLPRITRELPLPFVSQLAHETPNVFQLETILYGLLIIGFLLLEPRGLFGLWLRVRNYWKSFPFSY